VKTFEQVRAHLIAHAPAGVTVDVEHLNHGHPVRADPEHPYLQAVAKALEEAFGHAPALIPEGGTIPAVALLQELGAVPVLAGFANRDENMHAPGENFRVASFLTARQACVRMLGHLATT
jgi:acetylornithine deacetylase/succinyl-diaminopimelate desuccinylase-like protein